MGWGRGKKPDTEPDKYAEEGLLTPRQLKAKQKEEWNEYQAELRWLGISEHKTYIGQQDTISAYGKVLDTGKRAIPVLKEVAEETGKPDGWVDDVRNNPTHSQNIKAAMQKHTKHPTVQSMLRNDILTPGTKRGLSGSRSINALLNSLSDVVNLTNRVDVLEEAVLYLAHKAGETDQRLDKLEQHTGLTKKAQKQLATELYEEGLTQEEIGLKLGKTSRTIRNWLKGN